ncbi:TPA: hypothetical protein SMF39_004465 [Serratia marcescens]|uniref:YebF family protein n=1 Tax=Serratia marcescens TaxID=615 RepID=UPI0029F36730|nr:hypothetical protein SME36J_50640 [Serratia marcescens]HEJ6959503.1 hypothetical protein [Serratia marcescens]
MTLNRKFSIFIVAIAVLILGVLFYPKKKCSDYTQEAVIEAIKSDFINNRMARWTADPEYLGTRKPDILIDRKEVSVSDVYQIPFTARGPAHEKKYFAIYACKNGSIEYSTNEGG